MNIILYRAYMFVYNPFREKERVPPNARKGYYYIIIVYVYKAIILYYTRVITSTRHTHAHVHVCKNV